MVCLLATSALAQTNTVRIFSTNYVEAASNFREVDGQLYNIQKSQRWENVRCKYQDQAGELTVCRVIEREKIGERPPPPKTDSNSGLMQSFSMPVYIDRGIYKDVDGAFILLKHFPESHLVTGQMLAPRLLRIGETNFNGAVVAVYDCGTPHMVPVVTSKTIKTP